jgi:hypothetical protein
MCRIGKEEEREDSFIEPGLDRLQQFGDDGFVANEEFESEFFMELRLPCEPID